jgi:hypothetical protein
MEYIQGACSKPLVLPEPIFVAIAHFPSEAHLSSLCCPSDPSPKGGAIPHTIAKQVGKTIIIFMINNGSPKLTIFLIVPLHLGGQKAEVKISQVRNPQASLLLLLGKRLSF